MVEGTEKIIQATSGEILETYWEAMSSLTPGESVNWHDFVRTYQILELWIEHGKLLWDLEQKGKLDEVL